MKRKEPKKNGRPSKLSADVVERFLTAVKLGSPYELACKYAGISFQTLQNWREKEEPEFVAFFESVSLAEGQAVTQWLALIEKHSHADAKWAAWKLERRYPQAFGRFEKHEVGGKDGGDIVLKVIYETKP